MTYIEKSLVSGEILVNRANIHWAIYLHAMFWAILALVSHGLTLIIAIPLALGAWIYCSTTEMGVTNRKIIGKWGLINRATIEQRLSKIDSIQIRQGIMGRVLNYGALEIRGSGTSDTPIRFVKDPVSFKREIEAAIDHYEQAGNERR